MHGPSVLQNAGARRRDLQSARGACRHPGQMHLVIHEFPLFFVSTFSELGLIRSHPTAQQGMPAGGWGWGVPPPPPDLLRLLIGQK